METNVINLTDLNHELKLIDISQNLSDYEDEQITKLCSALSDEKLSLKTVTINSILTTKIIPIYKARLGNNSPLTMVSIK